MYYILLLRVGFCGFGNYPSRQRGNPSEYQKMQLSWAGFTTWAAVLYTQGGHSHHFYTQSFSKLEDAVIFVIHLVLRNGSVNLDFVARASGIERTLWSVHQFYEFSSWMFLSSETNYCRHCNYHFADYNLCTAMKLSQIIRSQTELQILGIFVIYDEVRVLIILKQLQNDQLHLPAVVALRGRSATRLLSFRHLTVSIATLRLQLHKIWQIYLIKIKVIRWQNLYALHLSRRMQNAQYPCTYMMFFMILTLFENPCEIVSF